MAIPFSYSCPFCGNDSTLLNGYSIRQFQQVLDNEQRVPVAVFVFAFRICPNLSCRKFSLEAKLGTPEIKGGGWGMGQLLGSWKLIPPSLAKVFPDYVPRAILQDYEEACLILDASPKASATLARRSLQGIIRDFWGIIKPRLIQEIEALKEKVDPLTWKAIDAVRKIGNIGAHMESDVNLIIDVEPDEAAQLIWLIELLIREWYICRHEREGRLKELDELASEKQTAKTPSPGPPAAEEKL